MSQPRLQLLQAETRAEFAERSVQKLQKEVDRLEGMLHGTIIRLTQYNYTLQNSTPFVCVRGEVVWMG